MGYTGLHYIGTIWYKTFKGTSTRWNCNQRRKI